MRAESASNGLDGPNFATSYHSGQRGTYSGSGLERSGSFRESLENRILVTGPSTSRNTASSTEIPHLLQYLSLEHFSTSEQKFSLSGELRRVLGVMVEEHTFGAVQSKLLSPIASEDLKLIEKDKNVLSDKDKVMLRGCNGGPISSEEKMCGLPPGGDGWEKNKRKRSVGLNRVIDGDRDIKQPFQQRPNSESRLRPSDGIGFRLNMREDAQVGNQSPLIKGKASRTLRTGSGVVMNAPSNFLRSSGSIDGWEQSPCINKIQPSNGVNNRKGSIHNESSSPPVTQWVGQRPQKISRTRRVNVVFPISNLDDAQFSHEGFSTPDGGARMTTTDTSGLLISRGRPSSSHQSKLRLDNVLSPAVLSESEESGAVENKLKEKGTGNFELEDGAQAPLKPTPSALPTKKNKTTPKEEIGDGVRRQGRSGRGSVQSKSCLPLPREKLENVDSTKPLKNGKHGSERSERFQTFLIAMELKILLLLCTYEFIKLTKLYYCLVQ
ncbi:hypothetical protein BHM03_00017215 [Ensete ventricosum]|nr:hypothetical protein BHM03_00017215 [Ensete ventricosum]